MLEYPQNTEELNITRALLSDQQFANAQSAVARVETDNGGLSPTSVWNMTDWLIEEMKRTIPDRRYAFVESLYQMLVNHLQQNAKSSDAERSAIVIMYIFALRLVKADRHIDGHPNRDIIEKICKLISEKTKCNKELQEMLITLHQKIDIEGDEEEQRGHYVEMGVNLLANDATWQEKLRGYINIYLDRADKADIIDRHCVDAFAKVWQNIIEDPILMNEMKEHTLNVPYNLKLIYNIFGLLIPGFYKPKTSTKKLSETIGVYTDNAGRKKSHSKDYFNRRKIEQLATHPQSAIKTEYIFNHIDKLIKDSLGRKENTQD